MIHIQKKWTLGRQEIIYDCNSSANECYFLPWLVNKTCCKLWSLWVEKLSHRKEMEGEKKEKNREKVREHQYLLEKHNDHCKSPAVVCTTSEDFEEHSALCNAVVWRRWNSRKSFAAVALRGLSEYRKYKLQRFKPTNALISRTNTYT